MASDENHTPIVAMEEGDEVDDDEEDTEEDEEEEYDGDGVNNIEEEEEEEAADLPPEEDEEEEEDLSVSLTSDQTRSVTVAVPPPTTTANIPIVEASETVSKSLAKRPRIVQDEPIGEGRLANPPPSQPGDDQARKLFQRLWTDEDEIGLLQGFLDYSTQRGTSQNNPHDTALFYDQIKSKLQLDFNKNQLVEKLRRLKKKYRNVLARISSGKEISFKSSHDQATFEIARKIWGTAHSSQDQTQHQNYQQQQHLLRRIDIDDDMPPNFNPTSTNLNLNFPSNFNSSGGYSNHHSDRVMDERKSQHKSKRIRVKNEDARVLMDQTGAVPTCSNHGQNPVWPPGTSLSTPASVEETMKSRISPLFREMYERSGGSRGFGDGIVSPLPLSFACPVNMSGMEVVDDRWRNQHILELEVYSKRLELVQEHIKLTLEQLRSTGS